MRQFSNLSGKLAFVFGVQVMLLLPICNARATDFRVLHAYKGGNDGQFPESSPLMTKDGSLVNTTIYGGGKHCSKGCGTATETKLDGTETVLHAFTQKKYGEQPDSGLISDKNGNFYGTSFSGGRLGAGVAFKLSKDGTETLLHTFGYGHDGSFPLGAALLADQAGNMYGTTLAGGDHCPQTGCGTVFKLAKDGKETVLYSFKGGCDGSLPQSALIADDSGNLYGTTSSGGNAGSKCQYSGFGTVFRLAPDGTETTLYSFCIRTNCRDGADPHAGVIRDQAGNLYGTTFEGGKGGVYGYGTLYKLAPDSSETVLYTFCSRKACADGANPESALIADALGNFYGTAGSGGNRDGCGGGGCGTVFMLAADGTQSVLHTFTDGKDGSGPFDALISDGAGNLYGTAAGGGIRKCNGGSSGCGTVFSLKIDVAGSRVLAGKARRTSN